MLALDTDIPQPDSRLVAKFYSRPVKQGFLSDKEGRPIFSDVDYVEIFTPGDALNIVDVPVREDHKARFPRQWQHYLNKKEGSTVEIGTPVSQWPILSPAQVEELKAIKFYTVESIANASDMALSKIGMIAGKSPFSFRDDAIRYLQVAKDSSSVARMEKEKEDMALRLAENERQMAEMKELLEKLTKPEEVKKGK